MRVSPTLTPAGVKLTCSGAAPCLCAANSASRRLILPAASRAAMPLRSLPEEAAVAEVFGTLLVSAAEHLTLSMPI